MLLVEQTHKTVTTQPLPRMIATRRNAVAAAFLPEGRTMLAAAVSASRMRLFLWFVAIAAIVVAAFWTWWLACLSPVAILVERIMAAKERQFFTALAAILLGEEMLATDFAGWGKAYPEARDKVLTGFGSPVDVETEWLDFYLPRRADLDADMLEALGPDGPDQNNDGQQSLRGEA